MSAFDRRVTPARSDLAAGFLKGKVEATRFKDGHAARVCVPAVALRPKPGDGIGIDTELVYGEPVTVYDEASGYAWVQSGHDGYVGYLPTAALDREAAPATHRVTALRTFIYAAASIKTPDPVAIPHGAWLMVAGQEGSFARLADGRFVHAAHLSPLGEIVSDPVSVAEMFLHAPYLWGGRTSLGLDCSALVQTALRAAGHAAPRDSDMLERWMPVTVPFGATPGGLKRGDAVFWKGHCGLMLDPERLIHANGHHMAVAIEPLAEAERRIREKSYGPVTSIRRIG
jgi:cell wall-associated NlpC family hydrolase